MANEIIEKKIKNSIADWLRSPELKDQVAQALPSICTPDRMMRVICTAMQRNPKLMDCSRASLFSAFITCSQLGLEPDGRLAHLIPYGTTCQLIIDYKGLVDLVMRTGKVSNIHADIVCENDEFEYNMGIVEKHKIDFRKPRGEPYAVYAVCRFKDGSSKADVMSIADVDKVRQMSRGKNSTPWTEHYDEMAKKTVFRRLSKWLPLSPEIRDVIRREDERDFPQYNTRQLPQANPFGGAKPTLVADAPEVVDEQDEEALKEDWFSAEEPKDSAE